METFGHLVTSMPTSAPSIDQLKRALAISEQIEKLQAELASILGSRATAPASAPAKTETPKPAKSGKRTMSPEARARIAAAQRARWAKSKGQPSAEPAKVAPKAGAKAKTGKKTRTISPEARAKMAAAAKKRWAKLKN